MIANTQSCSDLPRVTVVMPVRNGESFVEDAINSISQQSLTDLEIVVVDDGSTDSTVAVLKRLATQERRLRILTQPPTGITAALQAGCAEVQSQYIARMDADDLALPHRLAAQIAFLDNHTEVAAVGGQIRLTSAQGEAGSLGRYPTSSAACHAYLAFGSPLAHPAVTLRRDALERAGGYRSRFEPAEDYDLWLRLSSVGALANLDREVLLYRVHTGSTTRQRAAINARAAAMALCAHRYGEQAVPKRWEELHADNANWKEIEEELAPAIRLPIRAAYLRASALNGGIVDDHACSLLIASMPALARADTNQIERDMLAFVAVRAAYQLARSGRVGKALQSIWRGFCLRPGALLNETAAVLVARLRSRHFVRSDSPIPKKPA